MPVFEYSTTFPHPRDEVFAWHERPGAFVRLTPPGLATVVSGPTDGIREGSRVTLRVSHPVLAGLSSSLPLPALGLEWQLRHFGYEAGRRFVDEQLRGPFRLWRHEHEFSDGPDGSTTITDRVTWELPGGVPRRLVHEQLRRFFDFRSDQLRGDLALWARLGGTASPHHVVVAGASGLIGTQVVALLSGGGHRVTRLVRRQPRGTDEAWWAPDDRRLSPELLATADAVVNLSGRSIGGRMGRVAKQEIHHSRIDATQTLVTAMRMADPRPPVLVQASAIGFYGARRPGEVLREDSAPGRGFLADVVTHWEAAAAIAAGFGVRVTQLRTGIVLSEAGGALLPQVPLFFAGVGGRLTAPGARLSWITLDDIARAFVHAIFTEACSGPLNAVAPEPATAQHFATTLGRVMGRPARIPTPPAAPRLLLGRRGYDQLIRTDQDVAADRLLGTGFAFAHPDLRSALTHVLMR